MGLNSGTNWGTSKSELFSEPWFPHLLHGILGSLVYSRCLVSSPPERLGKGIPWECCSCLCGPPLPRGGLALSPNLALTWHLPQFCLELYNPSCRGQKIKACKTDGDGKVVEGKHDSYRISAANAEERDQWIEAIR